MPVNPYNFAKLAEVTKTIDVTPHHKFQNLSGYLECRILTKTRMFIPSRDVGEYKDKIQINGEQKDHNQFFNFFHSSVDKTTPVIPGSTLKGMLRTIVGALSDGCLTMFFGHDFKQNKAFRKLKQQHVDFVPPSEEFNPARITPNGCNPQNTLCHSCNLFGVIAGNNSIVIKRIHTYLTIIVDNQEKSEPIYEFKNLEVALTQNKEIHDQTEIEQIIKELNEGDCVESDKLGLKLKVNINKLKLAKNDYLLKINGKLVTRDNFLELLDSLKYSTQEDIPVHKAKVTVSDATAVAEKFVLGDNNGQYFRLKALGQPSPRHVPFYGITGNEEQIRGRKFYYHHNNQSFDNNHDRTNDYLHGRSSIPLLDPGAEFTFKVHFNNLSEEELGLLLWAIELDDLPLNSDTGLGHKIGMAKPFGLGSCRIKVEKMVKFSSARYQSWDNKQTVFEQQQPLRSAISDLQNKWRNGKAFDGKDDLKNLLTLDQKTGIQYPQPKSFASLPPLIAEPDPNASVFNDSFHITRNNGGIPKDIADNKKKVPLPGPVPVIDRGALTKGSKIDADIIKFSNNQGIAIYDGQEIKFKLSNPYVKISTGKAYFKIKLIVGDDIKDIDFINMK